MPKEKGCAGKDRNAEKGIVFKANKCNTRSLKLLLKREEGTAPVPGRSLRLKTESPHCLGVGRYTS